MKNKFIKIMALSLSMMMFTACGTIQKEKSENYYKLSYYDGTDETVGYNNNLFYQNNYVDVGPDPSVVYGKGSDNKDYFYIFPTDTQYSFYAYRSSDMSNLQGVGTVFLPEKESWLGGNMWAPDVIYDPNVDDGQGGKGLYYMFFTGKDQVRIDQNSWYFKNRADRIRYQTIAKELDGLSNEDLINKLAYSGTPQEKVASLCAEYNVANVDEAAYQFTLYEINRQNEQNRTDISLEEKSANVAAYAKAALLEIRSADILKMNPSGNNLLSGCVAVSKTLDGPFVQYTNDGLDGNRKIDITQPFFSHEDIYEALSSKYLIDGGLVLVDLHAFIDPKTGDKYMYFNSSPVAPHSISSVGEIFVVKVGDRNAKWTDDWQWDTVTQLTRTGYVDMGNGVPNKNDAKSDLGEDSINEGAYVIYNENSDKYYMTMSKGSYLGKSYAVLQAISDSPMGPFKKLSRADGGLLLQSETSWNHVTGPGHNSLITYNGKTYIVYHTQDTPAGKGNRVIAMDEVQWVKNSNGDTVMYVNGPSSTPQPRINSGYYNVSDTAKVTVNGVADTCLNDGVIESSHEVDFVKKISIKSGITTIKLNFQKYRKIRALMIYNSNDYETAFESVRRIEFDFAKKVNGETVKGTAYIDNLKFNEKYFYELYGQKYILPAAAALAEFEELSVKEIRIIFDTKKTIDLSEIMVLGR
jgi:hypothetical protein